MKPRVISNIASKILTAAAAAAAIRMMMIMTVLATNGLADRRCCPPTGLRCRRIHRLLSVSKRYLAPAAATTLSPLPRLTKSDFIQKLYTSLTLLNRLSLHAVVLTTKIW